MQVNQTELVIQALENGTVIDHIPVDKLFQVVNLLHLDSLPNQITIANGLASKKMGAKGMIKISDKFFEKNELDKIALIAPNAKINIIKDYKVTEKMVLDIPEEIIDILHCVNPMCVTNKERSVATRFYRTKFGVKCHYCERSINIKDIVLK